MKRLWDVPRDVRTVHLCSCTPEHATQIGETLDAAGIAWWAKIPPAGFLSFLVGEREHHVFVDRERLEEAKLIARNVLAEDTGVQGEDEP
jgi:hypothetical protein